MKGRPEGRRTVKPRKTFMDSIDETEKKKQGWEWLN